MRPAILITKWLFPETVALLQQHADVDYALHMTTASLRPS